LVQNDKAKHIQQLPAQDRSPENYQRFAREIRDHRIVVDVLDSMGNNRSGGMDSEIRYGHQLWKRMFVFGAGASANCVSASGRLQFDTHPWRPPLGYDIFRNDFDELIRTFPGAQLSIPLFEDRGFDIENCLEEDWKEITSYYNPRLLARHLNVQYYVKSLFQRISSSIVKDFYRASIYSRFVLKLQNYLASHPEERIALTSFNYDTILDDHLAQGMGMNLSSIDKYCRYNDQQILLFKPHGSVNWGWPLPNEFADGSPLDASQRFWNDQTDLATIFYRIMGTYDSSIAHGDGVTRQVFTSTNLADSRQTLTESKF
jgi:hypothetical protein